MKFKNYYKILGVKRTSSTNEIKLRFKELALKYHPDKNPDFNSHLIFNEILEAYQTLSDLDKRLKYAESFTKHTKNII